MEFRNRCGGRKWAVLDDERIEVEGLGIAVYEPGTVQYRQLAQTHESWGCLVRSKASAAGIPISWALGIMTTETGLWSGDPVEQSGKLSYAGAVGLMQVMPATARQYGYTIEQMYDPSLNVECGTKILARLANIVHDLPAVAAIYNSGFVCKTDCAAGRCCKVGDTELGLCGQGGYSERVLRWNNTAITYLDLGLMPCVLKPLGIALALGGLGYAAA